MSPVLRWLLSVSPQEAEFAKRGFTAASSGSRRRLETIGKTFLNGYNSALRIADYSRLKQEFEIIPAEDRGFAYEGAAMAIYLAGELRLARRSAFEEFLTTVAEPHVYMAHVGAGWAMARLPWLKAKPSRAIRRMNPLYRWLALDGMGFHETYFHPKRTVQHQIIPAGLGGYEKRAFDQGVGRALWFVFGASVDGVAASIRGFDSSRQADLWSGAGLAAAYAGTIGSRDAERLLLLAGTLAPDVAQGVAFAATARYRAGNPASHTDGAARLFCGLDSASVARTVLEIERALGRQEDEDAYERWRLQTKIALRQWKEMIPA
jgi:hypothetical protein